VLCDVLDRHGLDFSVVLQLGQSHLDLFVIVMINGQLQPAGLERESCRGGGAGRLACFQLLASRARRSVLPGCP
jgi:hypothetical protein